MHVFCFFFFQAEDGIRDLVRSRGLGDVYKRQVRYCVAAQLSNEPLSTSEGNTVSLPFLSSASVTSVSYTHLTLPTSDLV